MCLFFSAPSNFPCGTAVTEVNNSNILLLLPFISLTEPLLDLHNAILPESNHLQGEI